MHVYCKFKKKTSFILNNYSTIKTKKVLKYFKGLRQTLYTKKMVAYKISYKKFIYQIFIFWIVFEKIAQKSNFLQLLQIFLFISQKQSLRQILYIKQIVAYKISYKKVYIRDFCILSSSQKMTKAEKKLFKKNSEMS